MTATPRLDLKNLALPEAKPIQSEVPLGLKQSFPVL
jgi:hypothetical protein